MTQHTQHRCSRRQYFCPEIATDAAAGAALTDWFLCRLSIGMLWLTAAAFANQQRHMFDSGHVCRASVGVEFVHTLVGRHRPVCCGGPQRLSALHCLSVDAPQRFVESAAMLPAAVLLATCLAARVLSTNSTNLRMLVACSQGSQQSGICWRQHSGGSRRRRHCCGLWLLVRCRRTH